MYVYVFVHICMCANSSLYDLVIVYECASVYSCAFRLSPHQAHISDEFEVQSDLFGLTLAGLEFRVVGPSTPAPRHQHTVILSVQFTYERK